MPNLRTYWVGAVAAIATAWGVIYNGVDNTYNSITSTVTSFVQGPPEGSEAWFEWKRQQVEDLSSQIKDVRYALRQSSDWNTTVNLKFAMNTARKTCADVVVHHNEQAPLKGKPFLDIKRCD